jgi:ribonuclease III
MAEKADVGGAIDAAHERLGPLEQTIGYRFDDRRLLHGATIHRSFANEAEEDIADNEVMEFLGDAVLGLVISELLYRRNPDFSEGEMSKLKAFLVSSESLARRAEEIGLGAFLVLGKGEEKTEGRLKDSLLANSFEAVIAAVYLDGGLQPATEFIDTTVYQHLTDVVEEEVHLSDFKSLLQERMQSEGRPLPRYSVVDEHGPDHDKVFRVVVEVDGTLSGEGEGKTKKAAEQVAAERTLDTLAG